MVPEVTLLDKADLVELQLLLLLLHSEQHRHSQLGKDGNAAM